MKKLKRSKKWFQRREKQQRSYSKTLSKAQSPPPVCFCEGCQKSCGDSNVLGHSSVTKPSRRKHSPALFIEHEPGLAPENKPIFF